jgi:hypothetical protein
MPPHSHPLGVAPFWKGRHLDQPGRVHGTIVLHGETIPVDCFAGRDRSWGPRPMGPDPRKARDTSAPKPARPPRPDTGVGYSFATASATDSFLVYTLPHEDGSDDLTAGYLLRSGTYAPLVQGHRSVEFDPRTRWINRIHIEAKDELGRDLVADGDLVASHGETGPSGTGLFRWQWNGCDGWGEDQSYCSDKVWQAMGLPQ